MDKVSQHASANILAQKAYLLQQNLEYTPENVELNGLDGDIEYVATVGPVMIVTHKNDIGEWLMVIDRQTKVMEYCKEVA